MLFNSLHFLIFFPIVALIYFVIPHRFRWALLLISSYYFYMSWKAEYIILIIFSTLSAYLLGIQIFNSQSPKTKKLWLWAHLLLNLGMLFAFKYFNFFSDSVRKLLTEFSIQMNPITLKILLPVGISFYTFHNVSYAVDIYLGKIKPEKHLGIFALYVSFFPQLVAGPIMRAGSFLPQFFVEQKFEYTRITNGLKLMLWGFFKKIVMADQMAIVVNKVFNNVHDYTGAALILATFLLIYMIYCDFSGYTDIAIGSSQIFGITLVDNFRRPFFSKNIAEFWRRWHISLSSFFQDYFFTPMYRLFAGMNALKDINFKTRHWTAFTLSTLIGLTCLGFWHGAYWTFGFFGLSHGILIILYYIFKNQWDRMNKYIQIFLTFALASLTFIFFRANSLGDAFYVLKNIFNISADIANYRSLGNIYLDLGGIGGWLGLALIFLMIAFLLLIHSMQEHMRMRQFLSNKPIALRWSIYIILLLSILLFGVYNNTPFIYFQF